MYKGKAYSPETFLTSDLPSSSTVMFIGNEHILPDLPTIVVIGQDHNAETIKVLSKKNDGGFNIERGVEGAVRDWTQGETVARNFTNYDYQTLIDNVSELDNNKVDKVNGKQLSTNDFTDTQKEKLAGLSNYTHPATHPAKMITEDSTHRFVSDSEKSNWNNKYSPGSDISQAKTLSNLSTTAWSDDTTPRDLQSWIGDLDKRTKELLADKVGKTDIINDLTTGGTDKPLSAEQGKVLFQYADDGKQAIADAIVGKGGTATKNDSFEDLAGEITGMKTGYGVGDIIPEYKLSKRVSFQGDFLVKQISSEYNIHKIKALRDEYLAIKINYYDWLLFKLNGDNMTQVLTIKSEDAEFVEFENGEKFFLGLCESGRSYSIDLSTLEDKNTDGRFFKSNTIKHNNMIFGFDDNTQGIKKAELNNDGNLIIDNYYYHDVSSFRGFVNIGFDFSNNLYFAENITDSDKVARIIKVSPTGSIIWEYKQPKVQSFGQLIISSYLVDPSGMQLFSTGEKVIKLSAEGKKLWEYDFDSFVICRDCSDIGNFYASLNNEKIAKVHSDGRVFISKVLPFNMYSMKLDHVGNIYVGSVSSKNLIKINDVGYIEYYEVLK